MSSLGLLEEVDDELRGETEIDDSDWVGEASTDDSELFSRVWSLNDKKKKYDYDSHCTILQCPCLLLILNSCVLCGGVWCFYLHLHFQTERSFLTCTGLDVVIKSASVTKRRSSYVSTPMGCKCSSRMFLFTG